MGGWICSQEVHQCVLLLLVDFAYSLYPNASTKQFLAIEHLLAPLSLVHKSKLDIKISILLPSLQMPMLVMLMLMLRCPPGPGRMPKPMLAMLAGQDS